MAVRCAGCGRLTRDEWVCEWCRAEIPPEVRQMAAVGTATAGRGPAVGQEASAPTGDPEAVETVSRQESAAAVAAVPSEALADVGEPPAVVHGEGDTAEVRVEEPERQRDNATMVIWVLILLQFGLTLYLGQLSSWWSLTGFLWLLVGYGVKERLSWALALPLVLFTLDVAMLLFGVGPRERAGFYSPVPMDFFLLLLRLIIWGLIWRLRDELA
jgi:hypothetical protein